MRAVHSAERHATRLARHYASGSRQLQHALNLSWHVGESHLDPESIRPFTDRKKCADPGGVDEPDVGEVQHQPANPVLGQKPLDLGLELERGSHVEVAAGLDLDGRTNAP